MPEVCEMANVAVDKPPPPEKEFEAELVSVTFDSGIPVTHGDGKTKITPPHWEAGKEGEITDDWSATALKARLPAEPYSKRAAVYLIKGAAGAKYDVKVKVKVTKSKNISGKAKLLGDFMGLVIEGDCETGAGEHEVPAKIKDPPESIAGGCARISWGLDVPDFGCVGLGASLAEIYFVLAKPPIPYPDGVWSEALRFLCGKVGVEGETDPDSVAAKITTYFHGSHRLKYHTSGGISCYGASLEGGGFSLSNYIKRTSERCNCYDQAGAVNAFSRALGVSVTWKWMDPYGFIRPTVLVGFKGLCNNPFFGSDESKKKVDDDSKEREPFTRHGFAALPGGNILDACAGPHTGSEKPDDYLTAAIDNTPSLYPHPNCDRAGTKIEPGIGVTSVK
jgi:hypothetical protein